MTKTRVHVSSIENNAFETFSSHSERTSHLDEDVTSPEEGRTSGVLMNALKPHFISMISVGLFDYGNILKDIRREKTLRSKCLKAYRATLMFVLVANFLRYCMAYSASPNFCAELLTIILVHSWYLHGSVNIIFCYTIVDNPNKLGQFFTLWNKYWKSINDASGNNNTGEMENASICRRIRKAAIISTVMGWIFVAGHILFISYNCFYATIYPQFLTPLSLSHPQAHIAKVIFLIVNFYLSAAWVFTFTIMFLIQLSLYYMVKQFATKMDEEITTKPVCEIQKQIELYREQYNKLYQIIDLVDDTFQFNLGFSLLQYVFAILIVVYNILWYESVRRSPVELATHFY